jgi:hypothetical protein
VGLLQTANHPRNKKSAEASIMIFGVVAHPAAAPSAGGVQSAALGEMDGGGA